MELNKMCEKYEKMIQEVENEISAIDLNGKHIITDCKAIIAFLRDKLTGMKSHIQSIPFSDNAEEIAFFKDHKPMLLGTNESRTNFLDKIQERLDKDDEQKNKIDVTPMVLPQIHYAFVAEFILMLYNSLPIQLSKFGKENT